MVSLRYLVWMLLSGFFFCIALVVLALSRQIAALDHGWINPMLILTIWAGTAIGLKRMLVDEAGSDGATIRHRMPTATLDYRRR